jgi:hypothetical protein
MELLVSMAVFTLVAALCTQATIQIADSMRRTASATQAITQVRLALGNIERQVRSGNVLFNPVDEAATTSGCQAYGTTGGSCMRVSTQLNGVSRCVAWQVIPDPALAGLALLRTRSYSPTWQTDNDQGAWFTSARGLQLPTASTPPFQRPNASAAYGGRLLDVTLIASGTGASGQAVTLTSSLEGRNTTYGSEDSQCTPGPS